MYPIRGDRRGAGASHRADPRHRQRPPTEPVSRRTPGFRRRTAWCTLVADGAYAQTTDGSLSVRPCLLRGRRGAVRPGGVPLHGVPAPDEQPVLGRRRHPAGRPGGAGRDAHVVHHDGLDHGQETQRWFCSACGSPIYSISGAAPGFAFIKAGSLDDASWLEPSIEVWTSSAQPWAPTLEGAMRFERGPG